MSEFTERFVLDSNIVSRIVRRDARVILRLAAAIRANAEIYLCDDADLLIAAYTSHLRATLVTNNTQDFSDLNVPLVDWLA
jgi:predicted nucleic acid-binding protein